MKILNFYRPGMWFFVSKKSSIQKEIIDQDVNESDEYELFCDCELMHFSGW